MSDSKSESDSESDLNLPISTNIKSKPKTAKPKKSKDKTSNNTPKAASDKPKKTKNNLTLTKQIKKLKISSTKSDKSDKPNKDKKSKDKSKSKPKSKNNNNNNNDLDIKDASGKYKKMSQHEHIIKRPDTYIGPVILEQEETWVYDEASEKMIKKSISYVPGLFKVFDEILVNAADNLQRDPEGMDTLKVDIDLKNNEISIYNNGQGIPILVHNEHKVYIPEMIFGQLLTSSNYNDDEERTTGGRNGFGAKLTNICSTKFEVETVDSNKQLKYKQTWTNNMYNKSEPKITPCPKDAKDYTRVTFTPDLNRFSGMKSLLDNDTVLLMKKRVYDIAATCQGNLKVYLNKERIDTNACKDFKHFVKLHLQPDNKDSIVHKIFNDRWEVAIGLSDGQAEQVSFVNSINTLKGGTHVNYIAEQLIKEIVLHINKKEKNLNIKPQYVRNHLFIFVNALIVNPSFDTQTKTNLTTKKSQFGSKCELDDKFIKQVLKSGIVDHVTQYAEFQSNKQLTKNDGKKKGRISVPKLEDANDAD